MSIPQNWRAVKLGDVCQFKYGKSLPESQPCRRRCPCIWV